MKQKRWQQDNPAFSTFEKWKIQLKLKLRVAYMMYHNKVNPCMYGFLVGMIYIQPSASGQLPQDGVSIRSIQNAARNQLRQQCYAPKVLARNRASNRRYRLS